MLACFVLAGTLTFFLRTMSEVHPKEAHHVKKGSYILLKDRPCKVVEVKTSKTGKHGHAKCNITGMDVLTGKKYNEVHPGHINLRAFDLTRTEFDVMDINEEDELIEIYNPETEDTETIPIDSNSGVVKDLIEKFKAITDDTFYQVIITHAPYGPKDGEKVGRVISEFKVGKD